MSIGSIPCTSSTVDVAGVQRCWLVLRVRRTSDASMSTGSNSWRIFFPQILNKRSPRATASDCSVGTNTTRVTYTMASDDSTVVVIDGGTEWHGTIDVVIAGSVEKVWAIASDWLAFPRRCALERAEGENGVPGCVRRVQALSSPFWVAEKLTHIDHHNRFLAYDLVGGNSGIAPGYKAAFQVMADGEGGTRVVWPFMFSPEQLRVDTLTDIVKQKVRAHIQELEELAQES